MTTWATTTYTRDDAGTYWESHRDLRPDELPRAVYAVEASDSNGRSYSSNGLRWTEADDARTWASGLALRWLGCTNVRVVRVTPPTVPCGAIWTSNTMGGMDVCALPTGHPSRHDWRAPSPAYTVVEVIHQTL